MKSEITQIKMIEEKYGLVLFRTGLSHLIDVGHRNLDDENVAECIKQIHEKAEAEKETGKISVMTPEFQCDIVRCAAELAKFGIWDLIAYIKKYVVVK